MADHILAPLLLGTSFQNDRPFVFQCLKNPGDKGDRFVVSKISKCFLLDTQGLVSSVFPATVSLPALGDELLVGLGSQES